MPAAPASQPALRVEILSDTRGADLQPYMRHLTSDLRQHWLALIPRDHLSPAADTAETGIAITITASGHLAEMHLDGATHVAALDEAAWSATKSTAYQPLPAGKNLADLKLRLYFVPNPQPTGR